MRMPAHCAMRSKKRSISRTLNSRRSRSPAMGVPVASATQVRNAVSRERATDSAAGWWRTVALMSLAPEVLVSHHVADDLAEAVEVLAGQALAVDAELVGLLEEEAELHEPE